MNLERFLVIPTYESHLENEDNDSDIDFEGLHPISDSSDDEEGENSDNSDGEVKWTTGLENFQQPEFHRPS